MKILSKLQNKLPICLLNKEYIDVHNMSITGIYPTMSDLHEYFIPLEDDVLGYMCYMRNGHIDMLKGILYNNNGIIIIVYKDTTDHQFKAYINQAYIEKYPSHKTLLNKFARFYGVNIRKNIKIIPRITIDKFFRIWTPSMKDYEPEEQLKQSKNFLNYKKWQTPNLQL